MPRFEIFPLWSTDHYVIWNDSSSSYIRKHYPKTQFLESKMDMSVAIWYARNDGCGPIRIKNTSLTSLLTLLIISVSENRCRIRTITTDRAGLKWAVFKQKLKIRYENLNVSERVKLGVFVLKRAKFIFSSFKWILLVTWWVNQSKKRKLARSYHMYPITVFAYLKLLFRQCHTVVELVNTPSSKNSWTLL